MIAGLICVATPASADFQFQVYAGVFRVLPDFSSLTPDATGQSTTIGTSVTPLTDEFGLVFTNTINVTTSATYEFHTESDDGSPSVRDGRAS